MEEEIKEEVEEETSDTPEESTEDPSKKEETPFEKEETPTEEQETSKEPEKPKEDLLEELVSKNKQLYARVKKAEESAKKAQAELEALKKKLKTPSGLDVEELVEVTSALTGLDDVEKARLIKESKLTGASLRELREDEDFKLWQKAYREKVEKEKALAPSTRQTKTEKQKTLAERLAEASLEEKEKILLEEGLWKSPRRMPQSERIPLSNG